MLDGDEDERLLTLTTKEVKQLAKMADSQLVNERSVRIIYMYSIYAVALSLCSSHVIRNVRGALPTRIRRSICINAKIAKD